MAFEFDLDQPDPILAGPSDYVIDFTLGYDLDRGERVMMSVVLLRDEDEEDIHELAFGIRIQNLSSGVVSDFFYDHATARRYVTHDHRQVVSLLVLRCTRLLVEAIRPPTIVMETFEEDLPPAAMGKYMRICNHLGQLGYDMIEYRRDGTDRKDYWLFTIPVAINP